jgi:hypothetical protein
MKFLPSTDDLCDTGEYFGSPQDFLASFGAAYDSVRGQLLKYEGQQEYQEINNPSYDAFLRGDMPAAIALIRTSKKGDGPFYKKLATDKVDIVRVRSVKVPRSRYLDWEIENYKVSEEYGERIYFFNYEQLRDLLETNVRHDFMIFDSRLAFIHNYDDHNVLRGGWRLQDFESICKLLTLFAILKANAVHYRLCI